MIAIYGGNLWPPKTVLCHSDNHAPCPDACGVSAVLLHAKFGPGTGD